MTMMLSETAKALDAKVNEEFAALAASLTQARAAMPVIEPVKAYIDFDAPVLMGAPTVTGKGGDSGVLTQASVPLYSSPVAGGCICGPCRAAQIELETIRPALNYADCATACDQAAELIESGGWIQNDFATPDGHCLLGALNRILFSDGADRAMRTLIYMTITDEIAIRVGQSISRWNDSRHRVKGDVLRVLRETASHFRARATA
jgi:hypothetical protein